jgi:hypothetical protein
MLSDVAVGGTVHVPAPVAVTVIGLPATFATVITVPPNVEPIVAVKVKTEPVQLPDVGVTLYVAVTAPEVLLVKVPVIALPEPDAPPVRPEPIVGLFHAYVVPLGIVPVGE